MKYLLLASLMCFFIYGSTSCISTSTVGVEKKSTFPTVTGTDLHGEERTLPDYLFKERTIVVVAFERWQQKLCDEWYVHIEKYMQANEHTAYFEIPTIAKMNAFTRWFIYRGMRGGITDEQMRNQVITLHIDKTPFKEALEIDTEKTVFIYVMDEGGQILESIKGPWSEGKWQQAVKVLDSGKL